MRFGNFVFPADMVVVSILFILLSTCVGFLFTDLSLLGIVYGFIIGVIINCIVWIIAILTGDEE